MTTFEKTRLTYSRCLWVTLLGWLVALVGIGLGAGGGGSGPAFLAGAGTVVGLLGFLRGAVAPVPRPSSPLVDPDGGGVGEPPRNPGGDSSWGDDAR